MNWRGTPVLVTGAGGFIGSHLVERLVSLKAKTRALVHYNSLGSAGWLDESPARGEVELIFGDVCDRERLREAAQGVEIVFHLAALIAIPYSYQAPSSYVSANVVGTMNLLQTAKDIGIARIVHTSTSEVYGTAQYIPIDEAHPLQCQSPYAATKAAADKLAEAFYCSYNLPVVIVRPFNTFGPRQSSRAVIPTIITQLLSGGALRLGNLSPTRDFNFVANTVDGFVLAAETPDAIGKTVNLGSGREISIGDVAVLIARMMDVGSDFELDERRVRPGGSEVGRLLADNSAARRIMGWQPAVSLENGMEQTIDWFRRNMHRYRSEAYAL